MEKSTQEQIKAKLRAKIAEWTAEETEHWFCGSARNEGDLNDYLETLDMVVSDLKERIAYDDKPSLHRAEASTVLDELPHLKATFSEHYYQVIARMVAQAKVKSLQVKWSTKTGHGFRVFPVSVFRFVWGNPPL